MTAQIADKIVLIVFSYVKYNISEGKDMHTYKNPLASLKDRVDDLMARMSFEQKIDQITCFVTVSAELPDFKACIPNGIGNVGAMAIAENAEAIAEYSYRLQKYLMEETELGIPALIHCEAASGALFTEASVFPSAISQASSFNPENVRCMSELIREELYAVGFRQALSPVLDISRDLRWGRTTETYGEDPTLISQMCVNYIKGLQFADGQEQTKKIIATAKHFTGHGSTEGGMNMSRGLVSERELEEVHCKPFQAAVSEGGLMSVMNAYSSINGEPVACSKKLLTELLRDKIGFTGFVVSDYISIDRLVDPFCVAENYEEAGVRALKAGLDVEYPRPKCYTYAMKKAMEMGELDIDTVDQAVRRVLTAKFELGLFENPYPDKALLKKVLHTPESKTLNRRMAHEGLTLLKNNGLLPLARDLKRIAVIGPHADSIRSYFGTFSYPAMLDMSISREEDGQVFEEPGLIVYDVWQRHPNDIREASPRIEKRLRKEYPNTKTLVQAVREKLPDSNVEYALGISYTGNHISGMKHALNVAANADVIILTIGGKNGWGITATVGEGIDSSNIDLPGEQERFAREVFALGKKTVVVHFDGRPLSNEYIASHFDAILEAWQPGEYGGEAIVNVLFGDYNPAGRLPVTAPRNVGQTPVYHSLPKGSGYIAAGHAGMIRNRNGYVNDSAYPLYYFGHGLSYTEFQYSDLKLSSDLINPQDIITITINVGNIGQFDGDEVVQLYVSDKTASMIRPAIEYAGGVRIHLKAGEWKMIQFQLQASQLAFLDQRMNWIVEKGTYDVMAGASAKDLRLKGSFTVSETQVIDHRQRGFYAEVSCECGD